MNLDSKAMAYLHDAELHSILAGQPVGSLDVQARYFLADSEDEVREQLNHEKPADYANHLAERVQWTLSEIMAIEEVASLESGEELVGFIIRIEELEELAMRGDDESGASSNEQP